MDQKGLSNALDGLENLWAHTLGDQGVRIAILDGPVELENPSISNADLKVIDATKNNNVKSFHGTAVTSIIFGNHDGEVKGIAPSCSGLLKSIYYENTDGSLKGCSQSEIAQGIRQAIDEGANIINISGGEKVASDAEVMPILADVLDRCEEAGILVIAASGNEGDEKMHTPAIYPSVISVGSVDKNSQPSGFSNWTENSREHGVTLIGEDIPAAMPSGYKDKFSPLQGTSFSTAILSGVAALLASLQKKKTGSFDMHTVRQAILKTAEPCTASEGINCDRILAGRLNIPAAQDFILNRVVTNAGRDLPTDSGALESSALLQANSSSTGSVNSVVDAELYIPSNSKEMIMSTENQVSPSSVESDAVQPAEAVVEPSIQELAVEPSAEMMAGADVATPSAAAPSACQCKAVTPSTIDDTSFNPTRNQGAMPNFENSQLINAIGQPAYDFGMEANLDIFKAHMAYWFDVEMEKVPFLRDLFTNSPYDHKSMVAFLLYKDESGNTPNFFMSSQLNWLLNMNATPVYSICPDMVVFNSNIYATMVEFLADNVGLSPDLYQEYTSLLTPSYDPIKPEQRPKMLEKIKASLEENKETSDDVMRMVLPGYISGTTQLMCRGTVQAVSPPAYGLADWTVNALVQDMGLDKDEKSALVSILNRLYVSAMNKGATPDDRALNYSIQNVIHLSDIVKDAVKNKLQFSNYRVVPSVLSRQHSISREVQLTFFDPSNTTKASTTYSMEVDVSGITPISVGTTQSWQSPISVAAV